MQICLQCARQEHRMEKTECPICQGDLWLPRHVGGKSGNTDMDEAARLIREKKKPWARE